jgi:molecular chaperone GrpE
MSQQPETKTNEPKPDAAADVVERAVEAAEAILNDAPENKAAVEVDAKENQAKEPEPAVDPLKDMQEQLLRLRADFENFRKRTRREKEEWTARSLEHICGDLLAVLDSFELGLKNAADVGVAGDLLKGFALVQGQLLSILGKYNLTALDAENAKFDPNLHEAIAHVPSPEVPAEHVVAMTRRGYKLGERLLRPCQVVVSQGAPEAAPEVETPEDVPAEVAPETSTEER